MKVFISDLHISSPLFKLKRQVIDLFNDPNVESVYILGDLFDMWEGKLEKTLKKHADLINVINNSGKTEVILKGNHDPDIQILRDLFPYVLVTNSYYMEMFGKQAIIVHGDEFDSTDFWGKLLFPISWTFARTIRWNSKSWLRKLIYKNLLWRRKLDHNSLVFKMEKQLVERYSPDFDIIIVGHTHIAKMVECNNITYVNCGALMGDNIYLVADKNTLMFKRL